MYNVQHVQCPLILRMFHWLIYAPWVAGFAGVFDTHARFSWPVFLASGPWTGWWEPGPPVWRHRSHPPANHMSITRQLWVKTLASHYLRSCNKYKQKHRTFYSVPQSQWDERVDAAKCRVSRRILPTLLSGPPHLLPPLLARLVPPPKGTSSGKTSPETSISLHLFSNRS